MARKRPVYQQTVLIRPGYVCRYGAVLTALSLGPCSRDLSSLPGCRHGRRGSHRRCQPSICPFDSLSGDWRVVDNYFPFV